MTTVGVARSAAPFLLGFDSWQPTTDLMLAEAKDKHLAWVGRYLDNLTAEERDRIFSYELGIAPLTAALTHEPLTSLTGANRGTLAVQQARAIAMPSHVHITADDESPHAGSDVAAHDNGMARELVRGNLGASLYVGVPQPLSAAELFALAQNRYWKGGGRVPEPVCGWSVIQLEPLELVVVGGVQVDINVTKMDYFGRTLTMWWPA